MYFNQGTYTPVSPYKEPNGQGKGSGGAAGEVREWGKGYE